MWSRRERSDAGRVAPCTNTVAFDMKQTPFWQSLPLSIRAGQVLPVASCAHPCVVRTSIHFAPIRVKVLRGAQLANALRRRPQRQRMPAISRRGVGRRAAVAGTRTKSVIVSLRARTRQRSCQQGGQIRSQT